MVAECTCYTHKLHLEVTQIKPHFDEQFKNLDRRQYLQGSLLRLSLWSFKK